MVASAAGSRVNVNYSTDKYGVSTAQESGVGQGTVG